MLSANLHCFPGCFSLIFVKFERSFKNNHVTIVALQFTIPLHTSHNVVSFVVWKLTQRPAGQRAGFEFLSAIL